MEYAMETGHQPDKTASSQLSDSHIVVRDLTMAYGDFIVQHDINFTVKRGSIFVIIGGSGCGKSTLMKHMIGLMPPARGEVFIDEINYWQSSPEIQQRVKHRFGVMFQAGALWSSLTLAENIALPLGEYTDLSKTDIADVVSVKLALVGLAGFEEFYPSEISGGMQKRASLARAMALDPEILFFDEPSAGLDPISSRRLDELILELRDSLGTTFVVVTHELASIFTIADDSVFLDADAKTMLTTGDPKVLRDRSPDSRVRSFLNRGEL
jgi:phospholipid/cholesterol/gamma-HCH transport system ATP-binding protein